MLCVIAVARQIEAIRNGLTQVVPQAAFELFTWQEVEKRICGETEITIAALRQNSKTLLLYRGANFGVFLVKVPQHASAALC